MGPPRARPYPLWFPSKVRHRKVQRTRQDGLLVDRGSPAGGRAAIHERAAIYRKPEAHPAAAGGVALALEPEGRRKTCRSTARRRSSAKGSDAR